MTTLEFNALVRQYQGLVYTVCHQLVPDEGDAQDLAQETFLAAWRAIDRCPPGYEKQWLARIASNKAKDYLRSAWVRRVGTLTLGVCLIACGVLFLCYFFVPHFNWELALKIAPAAGLILLGCEVLYFAARPQRWKYDFLSVLLCIVLMVSAFGGACLMAAFDFALHREKFWIEYDARQERGLNDAESDRLRLDLDEGTGPDLDEENEDSSAASHTEV